MPDWYVYANCFRCCFRHRDKDDKANAGKNQKLSCKGCIQQTGVFEFRQASPEAASIPPIIKYEDDVPSSV